MDEQLYSLVDRLNDPTLLKTNVISWGCPVPSFGDLANSKIATIGLNPSNREFVDENGEELNGTDRRFHTLSSLGIKCWAEAKQQHLDLILRLCREYFNRNPYDRWFKKLDYLISGTSMSYYFPSSQACHLDLIPYATSVKWTNLTTEQRSSLLELTGDSLGILLKESPVELLVLNGKTVVDNFGKISNIQFDTKLMENWMLPRKSNDGVPGYAYTGSVRKIGGVVLDQEVFVLGYNHNIQSSFGVTKEVQMSIRKWISNSAKEIFA